MDLLSQEYGNEVIDFADLHHRGVELEFLRAVFHMFETEVEYQIQALEAAVAADNYTVIEICGHTIKGAASNISAFKLQYLATIVEHAGKEGVVTEARAKLPDLKSEFNRVVLFLSEVLVQKKP